MNSQAQVVPLPQPEAQQLLEDLATGRIAMGDDHQLQALCKNAGSLLGLLVDDICVASGCASFLPWLLFICMSCHALPRLQNLLDLSVHQE